MKTLKTLFLSIAVLLLIGAAQGAFAHDHFYDWTGHWQRYESGTTTQAWEFGQTPAPNNYNPNGLTTLDISNGVIGSGSLLIGAGGGSIGIPVNNYPVDNPFKLIFIQVTSDKALDGLPVVVVDAPGSTITTEWGPIIYDENYANFHTYTSVTRIERNPNWENITLNFYEDTNIEEIVIDTICVPEPSSIATLLASGLCTGVLVLRRRRR